MLVALNANITEFAGKPVVDWDVESGVADPASNNYRIRIRIGWEGNQEKLSWLEKFDAFLNHPASSQATGLVVGVWGGLRQMEDEAGPIVEAIVAAREKLPNLTAIYFGDVTAEECQISWIIQTDLSPLFTAYPTLEYFAARGGNGLSLGTPLLPLLRSLVIETDGLDGEIVGSVTQADLPTLEHLELWLGTSGYDAAVTVEDLKPILSGALFPRLKYLGFRNSEIADEIAVALATAPILERIVTLDLSLGTLGDEGMEALLASPTLKGLKKLDIHHHFCSETMVKRVEALDMEVNTDEREEDDDDDVDEHRYVAVGE